MWLILRVKVLQPMNQVAETNRFVSSLVKPRYNCAKRIIYILGWKKKKKNNHKRMPRKRLHLIMEYKLLMILKKIIRIFLSFLLLGAF
jgi:predicted rRNA methylase YqxC with S4 and FtsJ domains